MSNALVHDFLDYARREIGGLVGNDGMRIAELGWIDP